MKIETLGPSFAARISGLDFKSKPDASLKDQLNAWLAEFAVLVFPS